MDLLPYWNVDGVPNEAILRIMRLLVLGEKADQLRDQFCRIAMLPEDLPQDIRTAICMHVFLKKIYIYIVVIIILIIIIVFSVCFEFCQCVDSFDAIG